MSYNEDAMRRDTAHPLMFGFRFARTLLVCCRFKKNPLRTSVPQRCPKTATTNPSTNQYIKSRSNFEQKSIGADSGKGVVSGSQKLSQLYAYFYSFGVYLPDIVVSIFALSTYTKNVWPQHIWLKNKKGKYHQKINSYYYTTNYKQVFKCMHISYRFDFSLTQINGTTSLQLNEQIVRPLYI